MNRIYGLSLAFALLLLNGCTVSKRIDQLEALVKKLEARLAAIEKIVMPGKPEPQQSAYDIPLGDSPVLGKADAKVNIVVFSNFQCPHCAIADKQLRKLAESEEFKDKINVVFKHFPFDRFPESRPAALATLAAKEQNKFWEYSEKVFQNFENAGMTGKKKTFEELAADSGLDVAKFKKDLKDNEQKYNEIIDRDIDVGAKNAKLEGTPWILISGWLLEGELNSATLNKMIEEKKLL